MKGNLMKPSALSKPGSRLGHIQAGQIAPFPPPYEDFNDSTLSALTEEKIGNIEASLDDTVAIGISRPKNKEEEEKLVR